MTQFIQESELSVRVIGDDAVIVNRATNSVHRLNAVGAETFFAFQAPQTRSSVFETLTQSVDFSDVDPDEARTDVDAFVDDLLDRRLIRAIDTPPLPRAPIRLKLWKRELKDIGAVLGVPVAAHIEVSTRCHLDCVHCYIPGVDRRPGRNAERKPDMTNDELRSLLDQLEALGCFVLTFTGGEIFIRPGMMELLEYASERGFILELFTSGTPLTADKAARLANLNIALVQISLYSHDHTTHDDVTQVRGSWMRSVAAAKELVARGIFVEFACTLMRSNIADAVELRRFADSVGVTLSFADTITSRTDGNTDTHDLRPTPEQRAEAIRQIPDFFVIPEAKHPDEPLCTAGHNMCAISANGDLLPCNLFHLPLGNVRETPLAELWANSPALQRLRRARMRDVKPSALGALPSYIDFCPGLNLLEEGDYLVPARVVAETTLMVERELAKNSPREADAAT
ncbi:MAG TPA: PqqD family peptide modification chaperone [Thermoanaerobaculia bacterium]